MTDREFQQHLARLAENDNYDLERLLDAMDLFMSIARQDEEEIETYDDFHKLIKEFNREYEWNLDHVRCTWKLERLYDLVYLMTRDDDVKNALLNYVHKVRMKVQGELKNLVNE